MISSSESRLILTQLYRADRSGTDSSSLLLDRERESSLTICESDDIRSGDDDSSRESPYLVYEDGSLDKVAAFTLCLYRYHRLCRIMDPRSVWYRYPQQRYTRYYRMIYRIYSLCWTYPCTHPRPHHLTWDRLGSSHRAHDSLSHNPTV